MLHQKRVSELDRKAYNTRQSLVDLSNTAPINRQVRLRCACIMWELKQKYIRESYAHYVSKKSYEADLAKITAVEKKIIQGGAYEAEALEAVAEAKEYLELVAGYRVRKPDKNRVY
jgi:hypothetical protein